MTRQHRPATERTYQDAWRAWEQWCATMGINPMKPDPDALGCYLLDMAARYSYSTIMGALAAIIAQHLAAGAESSPGQSRTVRDVMQGIRANAPPPQGKQRPRAEDYRRLLDACDDGSLIGLRDAAMLALQWAGYFRATEITKLDTSDIVAISASEIVLRFAGRTITVYDRAPIRAVTHLTRWLAASQVTSGRLFRRITPRRLHGRGKPATPLIQPGGLTETGHTVRNILKDRLRTIGINPENYSGMSVRKGRITDSYRSGTPFKALVTAARLGDADSTMRNVSELP